MLGFHVGLLVLGTLYVINSFIKTFLYCVDISLRTKNEEEENEDMTESVKHMFI